MFRLSQSAGIAQRVSCCKGLLCFVLTKTLHVERSIAQWGAFCRPIGIMIEVGAADCNDICDDPSFHSK